MTDRRPELSTVGNNGYAVFLFPQALEALGDAVKPYLQDGSGGPHVLCREIDTGGALIEMSLDGHTIDGEPVELELMLPTSMVRMIVSVRSDGAFGFGPRAVTPVTRLPGIAPVAVDTGPAPSPPGPAEAAPAEQAPAKSAPAKPAPAKPAPAKPASAPPAAAPSDAADDPPQPDEGQSKPASAEPPQPD